MSDLAQVFGPEDLQPSEIPTPEEAPKNKGGRPRKEQTAVNPGDVPKNVGGRPAGSTKEAAEEKRRKEAEKTAVEIRKKTEEFLIDVVNPMLASTARMMLQVPENVLWMGQKTDQAGNGIVKANGYPEIGYVNGAQNVILQPFEIQLITLAAPYVTASQDVEKLKEQAKKIAPIAAIGGGLLLVAMYGMRLAQTKKSLDELQRFHTRLEEREENEQ